MKKINNIIAIAIIAIFAVACTNDEEVFDNNNDISSVNKKVGKLRKYASYEDIKYTDSMLQENLDLFIITR